MDPTANVIATPDNDANWHQQTFPPQWTIDPNQMHTLTTAAAAHSANNDEWPLCHCLSNKKPADDSSSDPALLATIKNLDDFLTKYPWQINCLTITHSFPMHSHWCSTMPCLSSKQRCCAPSMCCSVNLTIKFCCLLLLVLFCNHTQLLTVLHATCVGISTASSVLTFMYQWPRALHFCTAATHIYFVPRLWTHPRPNRVISPNDNILLLLIGCTLNVNLSPYQMYASDSLSTGILWETH